MKRNTALGQWIYAQEAMKNIAKKCQPDISFCTKSPVVEALYLRMSRAR
jgi:hypothetical protein